MFYIRLCRKHSGTKRQLDTI